jgi:hypothetical protein
MIGLAAMPFALWNSCGWAVIPTEVFISFMLLGIEEIGVQVGVAAGGPAGAAAGAAAGGAEAAKADGGAGDAWDAGAGAKAATMLLP